MSGYTLACEAPGYTYLNGEIAPSHLNETVEGEFRTTGGETHHLKFAFGRSFVQVRVELDGEFVPCKSVWAEVQDGKPGRASYVRYKTDSMLSDADRYEEVSGLFLAD